MKDFKKKLLIFLLIVGIFTFPELAKHSPTEPNPGDQNKHPAQNSAAYKEHGFGYGLFGLKANHLESYNRCQEEKIRKFANGIPSEAAIFHKRDIDFVLRGGDSNSLFWVYNQETARGVPDAQIFIYRGKSIIKTGKANAHGVWLTDIRLEPGDLIVVNHPQTRHRVFYKISSKGLAYETGEDKKNIIIETFSDRYLYRPGSTAYIGGIIKELKQGKLQNPGAKEAAIFIEDPEGDIIKRDTLQLDELGGFSYSFPTKKDAKKGDYEFTVEYKEETYGFWFRVDYYQPDAIKIEVTDLKEVYRKNDRFDTLITGYYLSGNPMSGDGLEYSLKLKESFYYRFFEFMDGNLSGYSFFPDYSFRKSPDTFDLVEVSETFNSKGRHWVNIDLQKLKAINYLAELHFEVKGETAEGKEFSTLYSVGYFPGNRSIGIKFPTYNAAAKPIKVDLAVIDSTGKLSEAKGVITIFKRKRHNHRFTGELEKIKEFKNIFKGKDGFDFTVEEPGAYTIKCDAIDKDGDVVTSSDDFYVEEPGFEPTLYLDVNTDKQEGRVGEIIPITILSPSSFNVKALITVERDRILDFFVIDLEPAAAKPFELRVKEEYFPRVVVNVTAIFKDDGIETEELALDIIGYEKSLNVMIRPESKEIEPSRACKLKVKITDRLGMGKKARAFVYAVNEGNLQLLYNYRVPDLFISFYFHNKWEFIKEMDTIFSEDTNAIQSFQSLLFKKTGAGIVGRVTDPYGNPIPGVLVILRQAYDRKDISDEKGHYRFANPGGGKYTLKFELEGFKTVFRHTEIKNSDVAIDVIMDDLRLKEKAMIIDPSNVPKSLEKERLKQFPGHKLDSRELQSLLRKNFRELLFFKVIETDEKGNAEVTFKTSDMLSTYRVMAIAYTGDCFGSAETYILVSKNKGDILTFLPGTKSFRDLPIGAAQYHMTGFF